MRRDCSKDDRELPGDFLNENPFDTNIYVGMYLHDYVNVYNNKYL